MTYKKKLLVAGAVAILAAALGAVADTLLLYNPNVSYLDGDYGFMKDISNERILAGAILGVLSIPFVLAGLWQLYTLLKPSNETLAIIGFFLGVYFCCVGVVVHALFAPMGFAVKVDAYPYYLQTKALLDLFSGVSVLMHIAVSLIFSWSIFRYPTIFPKALAVFNPLTIYILLAITYPLIPALGSVLAPAAFNLSFMLFFAASTYVVYKRVKA